MQFYDPGYPTYTSEYPTYAPKIQPKPTEQAPVVHNMQQQRRTVSICDQIMSIMPAPDQSSYTYNIQPVPLQVTGYPQYQQFEAMPPQPELQHVSVYPQYQQYDAMPPQPALQQVTGYPQYQQYDAMHPQPHVEGYAFSEQNPNPQDSSTQHDGVFYYPLEHQEPDSAPQEAEPQLQAEQGEAGEYLDKVVDGIHFFSLEKQLRRNSTKVVHTAYLAEASSTTPPEHNEPPQTTSTCAQQEILTPASLDVPTNNEPSQALPANVSDTPQAADSTENPSKPNTAIAPSRQKQLERRKINAYALLLNTNEDKCTKESLISDLFHFKEKRSRKQHRKLGRDDRFAQNTNSFLDTSSFAGRKRNDVLQSIIKGIEDVEYYKQLKRDSSPELKKIYPNKKHRTFVNSLYTPLRFVLQILEPCLPYSSPSQKFVGSPFLEGYSFPYKSGSFLKNNNSKDVKLAFKAVKFSGIKNHDPQIAEIDTFMKFLIPTFKSKIKNIDNQKDISIHYEFVSFLVLLAGLNFKSQHHVINNLHIGNIIHTLIIHIAIVYDNNREDEQTIAELIRCLITFLCDDGIVSPLFNGLKANNDLDKELMEAVRYDTSYVAEKLLEMKSLERHYTGIMYSLCKINMSTSHLKGSNLTEFAILLLRFAESIDDSLSSLDTVTDSSKLPKLMNHIEKIWVPLICKTAASIFDHTLLTNENFNAVQWLDNKRNIATNNESSTEQNRLVYTAKIIYRIRKQVIELKIAAQQAQTELEKSIDLFAQQIDDTQKHLQKKQQLKKQKKQEKQKTTAPKTGNESPIASVEDEANHTITQKSELQQKMELFLALIKPEHSLAETDTIIQQSFGEHIKPLSHKFWVYGETACRTISNGRVIIGQVAKSVEKAQALLEKMSNSPEHLIKTKSDATQWLRDNFRTSEITLPTLAMLGEKLVAIPQARQHISKAIHYFLQSIEAGKALLAENNSTLSGELTIEEIKLHFTVFYETIKILKNVDSFIRINVVATDLLTARQNLLKKLHLYGENSFTNFEPTIELEDKIREKQLIQQLINNSKDKRKLEEQPLNFKSSELEQLMKDARKIQDRLEALVSPSSGQKSGSPTTSCEPVVGDPESSSE